MSGPDITIDAADHEDDLDALAALLDGDEIVASAILSHMATPDLAGLHAACTALCDLIDAEQHHRRAQPTPKGLDQ